MNYTIGIDIGTGSTKAVAVSEKGAVIHTTQVSYPTLRPQPQYQEQAPEIIWQAFLKCISRMVDFMKNDPGAVVMSSAMHSLIPVRENGDPITNMMTWADNRSASIAARLRTSPVGEHIYARTGTPIHAMSPLCKIMWLREHAPSTFEEAFKFISIKEYIWYKLFQVYQVDHSIASATGMFDIVAHIWHQASLDLCGIQSNRLSEPVAVTYSRQDIQPDVAKTMKLPTGTPVLIGASDGCMANVGSFATVPGVAALTIGTSGAIRVGNGAPTIDFKSMTFNYCLFEGTYISGGPINNGGIVLKWYAERFLQKQLNNADDYSNLLGEIENIPPGALGLIFLPYILGERAPIWDSESSAIFFGLRELHTQTHLTRAVVEGISMALHSILSAMEKNGLTVQRVHVSGGFVHSKIWLQILADVFNKEIHLFHSEDASAIGAAYLGLKSLALITDYNEIMPATRTKFLPNETNHKVYQRIFPVYERLYDKLKDDMHLVQGL